MHWNAAQEVTVMRGSARRPGRLRRRRRRLLLGRNELRRPSDRIEGLVVAFLGAAFLAAAIAAACFAGHLYQSQRATAAYLRPAAAVLSRPAAPIIHNVPAGGSAQVWLSRPGQTMAARPSPLGMAVTALFTGLCLTEGAALVLGLCYLLCRMILDRHRLARWESAWAAVGPRWTSRR
jgi:hypothetical protein